jgi:integrase
VWESYSPKTGVFGPTKGREHREVPITKDLRPYLEEHLLHLGWSEGLVFGRDLTTPFAESSVKLRASIAWKAAGLKPIGFHCLRHSYGSTMLTIPGMSIEAVSRWMGHKDAAFTLRQYAHLLPNYDEEAMDAYDVHVERLGQ